MNTLWENKSAGEGIWTPVYRYDKDWHLVKIEEIKVGLVDFHVVSVDVQVEPLE